MKEFNYENKILKEEENQLKHLPQTIVIQTVLIS